MSSIENEVIELFQAVRSNDSEKVRQMVGSNPALLQSSAGSDTALTLAASNGRLEICRVLVEAGADVNQPAPDGRSALHKAAVGSIGSNDSVHREIVNYLQENGAPMTAEAALSLQMGDQYREKQEKPQAQSASQPVSTSKSGGCYIATACYGSYDHPDVMVLRRYRDDHLLDTKLGVWFVRAYYAVSPSLAHHLGKCSRLSGVIRRYILEPIVRRLD